MPDRPTEHDVLEFPTLPELATMAESDRLLVLTRVQEFLVQERTDTLVSEEAGELSMGEIHRARYSRRRYALRHRIVLDAIHRMEEIRAAFASAALPLETIQEYRMHHDLVSDHAEDARKRMEARELYRATQEDTLARITDDAERARRLTAMGHASFERGRLEEDKTFLEHALCRLPRMDAQDQPLPSMSSEVLITISTFMLLEELEPGIIRAGRNALEELRVNEEDAIMDSALDGDHAGADQHKANVAGLQFTIDRIDRYLVQLG